MLLLLATLLLPMRSIFIHTGYVFTETFSAAIMMWNGVLGGYTDPGHNLLKHFRKRKHKPGAY